MQQQELFVDEKEWAWCEKNHVRVIKPDDHEYPEGLRKTVFRPQTLYVMGEAVWTHAPLISVVGSRVPSPHSLFWLEKVLTELIGQHGWVTVSGGARGVDQKAHQMSLRHKKPTIVFVPAGLASPYPKELVEWYKPILDTGGAVISQFRPFLPMKKSYFPARNCLIAGISPVTLAVECRRRSGTWLTAKQAEENSRLVLVMPTHPLAPGLGGLDLIIDAGAKVVRDAADILSVCGNSFILPDAERQEY